MDGWHHVDFGAERTEELETLFRVAVRHHDQRPVALCVAHEREGWAGAPAGVLDDRIARLDQPVPLCTLDHRERHPVFHRPGWVQILELEPQLSTGLGHALLEPDERRVPDGGEDRAH